MTYLEQYITREHILPRNVSDWLMELKDPKNERQIKKIHEFIDYVENKGEKLLLYQKVNIELMLINDKIIEVKGNMRHNVRNQSNKIQKLLGCSCSCSIIDDVEDILDKLIESEK